MPSIYTACKFRGRFRCKITWVNRGEGRKAESKISGRADVMTVTLTGGLDESIIDPVNYDPCLTLKRGGTFFVLRDLVSTFFEFDTLGDGGGELLIACTLLVEREYTRPSMIVSV